MGLRPQWSAMDRIYKVSEGGEARHVIERDGKVCWLEGDLYDGYRPGAEVGGKALTYLPPVRPSKIIAVGLNYRDHALEMSKQLPAEPLIFMKPSTAVVGPEEPIRLPPGHGRVDHEAELAVVMRRQAYRVTRREALDYVLGYTCLNDVTERDLQKKDVQYTRAKGFDTFAPVGPCIAVGLDPGHLGVEGWVNGQKRQDGNTNQLIFPVAVLIEFVTSVMTLHPGDIISTGTPKGVGPLQHGDRVMIKIEGIGSLNNPVVES